MSAEVLLDAHGLVALLTPEPAGAEVEGILRRTQVAMTSVNLAEVADVLARRRGVPAERSRPVIEGLATGPLAILPVDARHGWGAASLRAHHYHRTRRPVSMADCVLLAAAAREQASVATADPAVLAVADAEQIGTVPLSDGGYSV